MAAATGLVTVLGLVTSPAAAAVAALDSPASASAVAGRRAIVVTWTAPPSGATVGHYTATAGTEHCDAQGPNVLTCTINNLTAGTPYAASVKACPSSDVTNTTGCSTATVANSVTPGPPGTPVAPTVTFNGGPNAVTLAWTAPDPGAGIASYRVTPTPSAGLTGTCASLVAQSAAPTCNFTGLANDTSYTFKVTAVGVANTAGSTGTSAASAASAAIVAGAAHEPANVSVTRASDTSVTVNWDKPSGNQALAGYRVDVTPAGGNASTGCTVTADKTECPIGNLDATKSYTFGVQALGLAPGSSSGPTTSASIAPGLPGVPSAPSIDLGPDAGDVTVTWQPPSDGGTVTGYTVTPVPQDGGSTPSPSTCSVAATVTSCAFTNLQNGKSYEFKVTATGAGGSQDSDVSDPVISQLPEKPATPTVTLGNAPGKVELSWAAATGGGPIVYYAVTATPSAGNVTGTNSAGCGFDVTTPTCKVTGLDPTKSYTFTVTAVGDLGSVASEPSDSIVPDEPGTPTSAHVALDSTTAATVTWAEPDAGTGGVVDHYAVTATPSNGGDPIIECPDATGSLFCPVTGLDSTLSYAFKVQAINGSGHRDATAAFTDVPDAPDAPTWTLGNGSGKVTMSWEAPDGSAPSAYQVIATSSSGQAQVCATTDATTCDVTGLSPAKSYTFAVRATNILGGAVSASSDAVIPAAPGTPGGVAVEVTDAGEVTVTWNAPTTGGPVDHYTVVGDPGGGCPSVASTGTLECVISGLGGSTQYSFTVAAVNNIDTTTTASTASVVPAAAGAPTNVHVNLVSNTPGSLTVSWTAPAGAPVTGYTVTPTAADSGSVPDTCATVAPTATSCTYTGLRATTSYSFIVYAGNDVGGDSAAASPADIVPDKPGEPTPVAVALGAGAPGTVNVTWTAPTAGGAVDHYTVTSSPSSTGCASVASDATLECVITALTTTSPYTFTVTAVNAAGSRTASSASVVPDKPGAPANVHLALSPTPGTATVTWGAAPGGATATYTVAVTEPQGGNDPSDCTVSDASDRTCTFSDLTVDKPYQFTVSATNASGTSSAQPTAPVIPNQPNPPGVPTGTVTAADTVLLNWALSPSGAGPLASYTVTAYATDAPEAPITVAGCTAVTDLHCSFSGLSDSKSYTFTVTANGPGGGTSDPSQSSDAITTAGPGLPGTPTVDLYGSNAVVLTWAAPETGGPIEGYEVTASPATATPMACVTIDNHYCVFTGLISGTPYTFTVTAHGTADREAVSSPSASIVPGPPDTPARPTAKANGTTGQVVVSWTAPDTGAGIAGYRVQSNPGLKDCAQQAGADATSCVVSGLDPATSYTFRVQAIGVPHSGSSAFSPSSVAIVPGAPVAPTDVQVAAGDGQIDVSWTPPADKTTVAHYRAVTTPGSFACATTTSTDTECIITGVANLTSYAVTVTTVATDGTSSPASEPSMKVRPTAGRPGSPTAVQAAPGDGKAVVSWTAPAIVGNGIIRYIATAVAATGSQKSCTTTDGTTLTCTITGLTDGVPYSVTVVGVGRGASGYSPASTAVTVTPVTPPGTPTGVNVVGGVKSLTVSWTAGGAGDGLAGYTVTATGGAMPLTCTPAATATTCTIANVTPGTYSVTVMARGTTTGVNSASSTVATGTALVAAAPSLSGATPTSSGTLTLSSATVAAGGTVTVTGAGFAPYTGVSLGLYAPLVKLATVTTDAKGGFTQVVTVPSTVLGTKTLVAGGLPGTGTSVKYWTAPLTVQAANTK